MILRRYPYPFDAIFSIGSDCDMMTPDFMKRFHQLINVKFGLPLTNSFWVYTHNTENILSLFRYPECTKNAFDDILEHYRRGDLDHIHNWYDDNFMYRLYMPEDIMMSIDKDKLKMTLRSKPTPHNLTTLNDNDMRYDEQFYKKHIEISTNNIIYSDNFNHNPNLEGCVINIYHDSHDIDMVVIRYDGKEIIVEESMCSKYKSKNGLIITSIIIDKFRCNEMVIEIKPMDIEIKYIIIDSINAKMCEKHINMMKDNDINVIYSSEHGGFTHNVSMSVSKLARADSYKFIDYSSIEFITGIPSTIDTSKNYVSVTKSTITGRHNDVCFYTGAVRGINPEFINDNKIKAMMDKYNIDQQSGSNIVISIMCTLLGYEDCNMWYTHNGTCPEDFYDLQMDDIYPADYMKWFGHLRDSYYGINDNYRRVFVCGAVSYALYNTMIGELKDRIEISDDGLRVMINSWESNGKIRLDEDRWSADLSYITIYVPHNDTKLVINGKERYNYVINEPDETGMISMTILDITKRTNLINKPVKLISSGDKDNIMIESNVCSYNTTHYSIDINKNISPGASYDIFVIIEGNRILLKGLNDMKTSYATFYSNINTPPMGRIDGIEIVMSNAKKGDYVEISDLSFYRANPNAKSHNHTHDIV